MTLSEILSISATGFIVVLIILILLAVIIVMLSKVIQAVEGGNKKSTKIETVKEEKPIKKAVEPSSTASAPVFIGSTISFFVSAATFSYHGPSWSE